MVKPLGARFFVVGLVAATAACGGNSALAPGPSQQTTRRIDVTLPNILVAGQASQATAVATLTSGGTQPVTTGFRSDTPAVASVSDGGQVTPIANGLANIYVVSGGAQGTKTVRVVPSFQGQWRGSYVTSTCSQTGFFASVNGCASLLNHVLPVTMSLGQAGDVISANFSLGAVGFVPVSAAPIGADGTATFSAHDTLNSSISNFVTWHVTSPQPGRLTGTFTLVWDAILDNGLMQTSGNIVDWLNQIAAAQVLPAARTNGNGTFYGRLQELQRP